jgi:hypothetical protein
VAIHTLTPALALRKMFSTLGACDSELAIKGEDLLDAVQVVYEQSPEIEGVAVHCSIA